MDVARVFVLDHRLQGAEDGSESRSEEAFAKSLYPVISFNPDESPVEVAFHDRGLESDDLHDLRRSFLKYW